MQCLEKIFWKSWQTDSTKFLAKNRLKFVITIISDFAEFFGWHFIFGYLGQIDPKISACRIFTCQKFRPKYLQLKISGIDFCRKFPVRNIGRKFLAVSWPKSSTNWNETKKTTKSFEVSLKCSETKISVQALTHFYETSIFMNDLFFYFSMWILSSNLHLT